MKVYCYKDFNSIDINYNIWKNNNIKIFHEGKSYRYFPYDDETIMIIYNERTNFISFDLKKNGYYNIFFNDYFYTDKEYRKMKLKKLNRV
jgi:transposase